jgi:subtilisin family serine protease
MWGDDNQLDNVDFMPEPTDFRIVSAVDPSTNGHQDGWRSEVVGWAPLPVQTVPVRRRNKQKIANAGIFVILTILFWALLKSEFFWLEIPPPTSEWAYEDSGARDLQEIGLTGEGVRLCMVDTGIDTAHSDFENLQLVFRDFTTGSSEPVDRGSLAHGTMMAGIVAADGYMVGAAPNIVLGMAAALGDDGEGGNTGSEQVVANAIEWCWETFGADIISLSLGGVNDPNAPRNGPTVNAVKVALSKGIFVVAAAGNDGGDEDDGRVTTPSNVPEVITVGASQKDGNVWSGSSLGESTDFEGQERQHPNMKPEIIAPGVDLISTGDNNQYYTSTGTSDSTALVSGLLALILESEPHLKNKNIDCVHEVKYALMNSTLSEDGVIFHDQKSGYGVINGMKWLNELQDSVTC